MCDKGCPAKQNRTCPTTSKAEPSCAPPKQDSCAAPVKPPCKPKKAEEASGSCSDLCGAPGAFNDNDCEPKPLFFQKCGEKGGCGAKCPKGM